MHYKLLLDPGHFLGPQDFPKPTEVTISRAVSEEIAGKGDEKSDGKKYPMLYLKDKDGNEYPRKLKIAKTVLHGLSLLLGTDIDQWKDKKIVLYATWCMSFGEKEECVRPQFPSDIRSKITKYCKKRGVSPSCYEITN